MKGPGVTVQTTNVEGNAAVKIESGNKSQTWVQVPGKPGEFALQPPAPDGNTPRARIDTSTQPPQVKEHVFNKTETNGVSTVTTDRNGNPINIKQADGTQLDLKWSTGAKQVLLEVNKAPSAPNEKPVELIERTRTARTLNLRSSRTMVPCKRWRKINKFNSPQSQSASSTQATASPLVTLP